MRKHAHSAVSPTVSAGQLQLSAHAHSSVPWHAGPIAVFRFGSPGASKYPRMACLDHVASHFALDSVLVVRLGRGPLPTCRNLRGRHVYCDPILLVEGTRALVGRCGLLIARQGEERDRPSAPGLRGGLVDG